MIENLISNFSNRALVNFFRSQNSSFVEFNDDLSEIVSDFEKFENLTKLGEISYDNTDVLMVFSCEYQGELTTRSSRKSQYDIAKKALKEDFKDGAVFVFYDQTGKFRFSFLRRNYGDKTNKYTPWRRYTYFVEPDATTNRTFIERVGSCKFDSLDTIQQAFSVDKLTEEFYKELSNWYFWAIKTVSFPNDVSDDTDDDKYNPENIIRLITRLIFVWFLKQKGLIRNELFDTDSLTEILNDFEADSKTQNNYYRAILQNLFFATLNQEIGQREFAEDKGYEKNRTNYAIKNLYRYEKEFCNGTDQIMELFSQVPFLNGGLFECLDRKEKDGKIFDWDGFSRNPKYQAKIPNYLFFAKENSVDLSDVYNDKKMKSVKVSGIIEILNRYNFTIEENTPVEIEVALDPELLGKVFENLLGAFNPETQETARKQTGSFYTPREIVNYMVDESLIAYFKTKVADINEDILRQLFSYDEQQTAISDNLKEELIQAAFDCKILDPACGSGAFPMGILQQMVHVLKKLDPDNTHWNNVVMTQAMRDFEKANKLSDEDIDDLRNEIEKTFDNGLNYPDYARKLHLIENCIYGVDIQSIAVQISKLRFFISLVCEQRKNSNPTENFGIRPLPNLETKFVAANTLIGLEKTNEDMELFNDSHIKVLIDKLQHVRHRQFLVTNTTEKKRLRDKDLMLRNEIENEIAHLYVKHADDQLGKYKLELKLAEKELELLNKRPDDIRTNVSTDLFGFKQTTTFNYTETKRKDLKGRIKLLADKITRGSDYSRLNSIVKLAKQLTTWNPYNQNQSSPFFDPEWMFGLPKVENGYFDVIIGNPPYKILTVNNTNEKELKYYVEKYISIKGVYSKNLYTLFIENALNLLLDAAKLSFIVPEGLFKTRSYNGCVEEIEKKGCIDAIVTFTDYVFENAVTGNLIFIFSKNRRGVTKNYHFNEIYELSEIEESDESLLRKIEFESKRLKEIATTFKGMVIKDREIVLSSYPDGKSDIFLLGKNISKWGIDSKYYTNYNELVIIGGTKRLEKHNQIPRILVRRTGNTLCCCYLEEKALTESTLYSVWSTTPEFSTKSLLGILNSKLLDYYNKKLFITNQQGFPQILMTDLELLPIKIPDRKLQNKIEKLIDQIFKATYNEEMRIVGQIIDNLVYRLYDLTYAEVKVIDPDIESKINEAEYNAITLE